MWHFRRKRAEEKIRNPIQGEFFSAEAIEGPSEALVRESIQNSLDARMSDLVRVRISLHTGDNALRGNAASALFGPAWPHYEAGGNGLHAAPERGSDCPFIVVEDFGTKGLNGDPAQSDPDPDPRIKNPFCMFFRAEGLSGKSGVELGRWGVGKFVFARSSLASTHFGLTVRSEDNRRLLLGCVTLKAHYIKGDPRLFSPDGLYGELASPDDSFVLPIEDPERLDEVSHLFKLTRTTEPGLSVIVPFVDPEITFGRVLRAVIKDYFLPIFKGRLTVEVIAGELHAQLTAATIDTAIQENDLADLTELMSLAKFSLAVEPADRIEIGRPEPKTSARWTEELISEPMFLRLQEKIDSKNPVAVRCPITVRSRREGDTQSYFDIYLIRDKHYAEGRPMFVREGIVISDVRGRRAREMRSMVVVEDRPLASMLGDSENPAHTQWQRDGSNFKGKYIFGSGLIQYVSDSVGELTSILSRRDAEADSTLTVDYFSIEPDVELEEVDEAAIRKPKPKPGVVTPGEQPIIKPRPTRIIIQRETGGFVVKPGAEPPQSPYLLEVQCAYDIRSGNPIRKWNPADFEFGARSVSLSCTGSATIRELRGNRAIIRIDGNAFGVAAKGFDPNRDVFVRAQVHEAPDAD